MTCHDSGDPQRSADALMSAVVDAVVRAELARIESRHVVVVAEPSGDHETVSGPYPDGFTALCAAEAERAHDLDAFGVDIGRTYGVRPLLSPLAGGASTADRSTW